MKRWFAMLAEQTTYAGIPIFKDNASYENKNGTASLIVEDAGFFLAGPFDLGDLGSKNFHVSRFQQANSDGTYAGLRMFNDLSATSVDYWMLSGTTGDRSIVSVGRYVIVPIPKAVAADMYLYMTVNDVKTYIFKGCNVTD